MDGAALEEAEEAFNVEVEAAAAVAEVDHSLLPPQLLAE